MFLTTIVVGDKKKTDNYLYNKSKTCAASYSDKSSSRDYQNICNGIKMNLHLSQISLMTNTINTFTNNYIHSHSKYAYC